MAKKILLADDSITIQKVISLTFASEDFELIIESAGDTALVKAKEVSPDLILADVAMPGLNGYQLCEAVKADAALSSVPVILLAGTFEPLDTNESARVGADDHIVKPFESEELLGKVKMLIAQGGRVMPQAAPAAAPPVPEAPAPVAIPPAVPPAAPAAVPQAPVPPAAAPAPAAPAPTASPSATDDIWEAGDFLGGGESAEESSAPTPGMEMFTEDAPKAAPAEEPIEEATDFFDLDLTEDEEIKPAVPATPAPVTPTPAPVAEPASATETLIAPPPVPEAPVPAAPAPVVPTPAPVAPTPPAPAAPAPAAPTPVPAAAAPTPPPAPAPAPAAEAMAAQVADSIGDKMGAIGSMPKEEVQEIVRQVAREVIEEVAWEVIPDMAEELLRTELIDKFKEALKKP